MTAAPNGGHGVGREHQAASNSHALPGTLTGGTRRRRAHPLRAVIRVGRASVRGYRCVIVAYGCDPLGQLTGSTLLGTTTAYGWDTTTNRTSVQVGHASWSVREETNLHDRPWWPGYGVAVVRVIALGSVL
jgi:YD repeat-containing protein